MLVKRIVFRTLDGPCPARGGALALLSRLDPATHGHALSVPGMDKLSELRFSQPPLIYGIWYTIRVSVGGDRVNREYVDYMACG